MGALAAQDQPGIRADFLLTHLLEHVAGGLTGLEVVEGFEANSHYQGIISHGSFLGLRLELLIISHQSFVICHLL